MVELVTVNIFTRIGTAIGYLSHFLPWMESPLSNFSIASFLLLPTSCLVSFLPSSLPSSSSSSFSMSSHATLTLVYPSSSSGYPLQSLPLRCVTKVWLSGGTYGEETPASSASANAALLWPPAQLPALAFLLRWAPQHSHQVTLHCRAKVKGQRSLGRAACRGSEPLASLTALGAVRWRALMVVYAARVQRRRRSGG